MYIIVVQLIVGTGSDTAWHESRYSRHFFLPGYVFCFARHTSPLQVVYRYKDTSRPCLALWQVVLAASGQRVMRITSRRLTFFLFLSTGIKWLGSSFNMFVPRSTPHPHVSIAMPLNGPHHCVNWMPIVNRWRPGGQTNFFFQLAHTVRW